MIKTGVDNSGLDKDIKELEKKIDQVEKKKIDIQVQVKTDEDNLAELEGKAQKVKEQLEQKWADFKSIPMPKDMNDKGALAKIDRTYKDYMRLKEELSSIIPQIEKLKGGIDSQKTSMEALEKEAEGYRNQIAAIDMEKNKEAIESTEGKAEKLAATIAKFQNALVIASTAAAVITANTAALSVGFKTTKKIIDTVFNAIKGIVGQVKTWIGNVFSLKNAYNAIQKLISEIQSYNKQVAADLSYMKFALASAFEPLIQALVAGLYKVLALVNQIIQVVSGFNLFANSGVSKFQKAMKASAGSSKEIANNLAKFDDLDVLKQDKGGGGGMELPSVDLSKSNFLEDFMGDPYELGFIIGNKINDALSSIDWDAIQGKVREISYNLAMLMNGLFDGIDWTLMGETVGEGINTVLIAIDTFCMTFNWQNAGAYIADAINGIFDTVDFELLGETLVDGIRIGIDAAYGMLTTLNFKKIGEKIAQTISAGFRKIDFNKFATDIGLLVNGIYTVLNNIIINTDWYGIGATLAEALNTLMDTIDFQAIAETLSRGFKGMLDALLQFLVDLDWIQVGVSIGEFLGNIDWLGIVSDVAAIALTAFVGLGISLISGILSGIIEGCTGIMTFIYENVVLPIITAFCDLFGIHSPSTVMAELGVNLIEGLIEGIKSLVDKVKEIWEKIKTTAIDKFNTMKTKLSEMGTKIKETLVTVFTSMKEGVVKIFEELWGSIKGVINSILGGVETMANGVVNAINKVIDALNSLKFKIPEWVPEWGGREWSMNIPKIGTVSIPRLAKGGIIAQPTQAIIGESGREAVLPLENNTEWLDMLEDRIVGAMSGMRVEASGDGQWGEFIKFLNLEIVSEQNRKGTNLIGGTV